MLRPTLLRVTSALLLAIAALVAAACVGAMPDRSETVAVDPVVAAGMTTFEEKCAACHTIGGGPLVGPDLAGVTLVRDHAWLTAWVLDPEAFAALDADAAAIHTGSMPTLGLGVDEVDEVLAYLDSNSDVAPAAPVLAGPRQLAASEFDEASNIYFNRCAGCHGTLRAGATGPNIQPERTLEIGTTGLTTILTNGLPGGMPAWGEAGILTAKEIELMANFVQLDPPTPPPLELAEITESWNLIVPVADRPIEPETVRNWENFTGVILRDAGQVALSSEGRGEM